MTDSEILVGEIFWAFTDLSVVAIKPCIPVRKGCILRIEGFGLQEADSIQVNHQDKDEVPAGISFGLLIHNSSFTITAVRKRLKSLETRAKQAGSSATGIKVFLHRPVQDVPSDSALREELVHV